MVRKKRKGGRESAVASEYFNACSFAKGGGKGTGGGLVAQKKESRLGRDQRRIFRGVD